MTDTPKRRGRPPKSKTILTYKDIPILAPTEFDSGIKSLADYLDYWKKEVPEISTQILLRMYSGS